MPITITNLSQDDDVVTLDVNDTLFEAFGIVHDMLMRGHRDRWLIKLAEFDRLFPNGILIDGNPKEESDAEGA